MHYEDALARQPPRIRGVVNRRLQALATKQGRQSGRMRGLIDATQRESRVDAVAWDEFFRVVSSTRVRGLERQIRVWAWSRSPDGSLASYRSPLVRVTSIDSFLNALQVQMGPCAIPRSILSEIVDQLMNSADWRTARKRLELHNLNLSAYSMWATFDPSGKPFAGLSGLSAEQIACDLGLDDPKSVNESYARLAPLMLLQYDPAPQTVHVPTMVEAWAAVPPNYYFSPAAVGTEWGLTRPWRSPPKGHRARSRPEVVHSPSHSCQLLSHALEVS
jgi:hypothetical protein